MSEAAKQLAKMLEKSKRTVFFGGAGVSTESGIPDFRSAHGLYGGAKGKSYEDMLHIRYFLTSPDEFWAFYKNVMLYPDARPNAAHIALARLEAAGHEAFVVGGAVRDCVRGAGTGTDWDITTSALPEETETIFSGYRVIETGMKHGTVTVLLDGEPLEITTYRVDGGYSDHRHPDEVRFTRSLREDLRRSLEEEGVSV